MDAIVDYIKEYKKIAWRTDALDAKRFKKLRIAVLTSSTTNGLKEVLCVKCRDHGVIPEIWMGGYNQYHQEILDDNSELYRIKPDLVILFIDTRSLLGEEFFTYYSFTNKRIEGLLQDKIAGIKTLVDKIAGRVNAKVVVHNLEVPFASPLGIIDNKQGLGLIDFVKSVNYEVGKYYRDNSQVFVFDYDSFCSRWGKENVLDYKMYYLGDIRVSPKYLPKLCEAYLAYIKPLVSLTKKCIVLDLDNTLWGGVIGEDGFDGIKLGPTVEGRPFWEFQKYLLALWHRGIILAVNSKNNLDDAMNVLRTHPYMVLKEDHFAAVEINWNDKVVNMKRIAQEINIGLDSLVFIDDDPLNREIVRKSLPEVEVVDWPEDPALYLKAIMELDSFNSYQLSEEDKQKGRIYAEQKKRTELSKGATDIDQFLKALDMIVSIEKATDFTIPRIAQLTQKTNQFNMTTRRYFEEDIRRFASGSGHLVVSIAVSDKFGDNGITGVVIVNKKGEVWTIDSFLLSCRVIGRRVEDIMLAFVLEQAIKEGAGTLIGEFVSTSKNAPAKGFYEKNRFALVGEKAGVESWRFSVSGQYFYPDNIEVIKK